MAILNVNSVFKLLKMRHSNAQNGTEAQLGQMHKIGQKYNWDRCTNWDRNTIGTDAQIGTETHVRISVTNKKWFLLIKNFCL